MSTLGPPGSISDPPQTREEIMADKQEKVVALPGMDAFKFGQMLDEAAKLQTRWFEASNQSIDESSELAKTSIKYFNDLSTEWRRLSLDSSKRALEFFAR